jgi:cytochrome c biogenesis protein CcmG/thiol:disulfide interchange protein DsbE
MRSLPVRALSLAAIVAGSFVLAMGARAGGEKNLVGETPPEIKADGWLNAEKPVSLADLKGKVVVVEFWATWCPPCRRSIPHLIQLHEKYAKDGVVIVGLTDEPKDKVEPFAKKMNMTYIVGYGSPTGDAYGVEGIPTAFVIGPEGKVVWSGHPMDENFEKTLEGLVRKKS